MIGYLEPRVDLRRASLAAVGLVVGAGQGVTPTWRKILVVRPDHLGDLLFLTPALRHLRQGFPTAEIVGLVGPWGKPVLENNHDIDRLMTWEFPWFDRQPKSSPIAPYASLIALSRVLRREDFDTVIQFRADFWWGALAARLAGIPNQIGYDTPMTHPFLTQPLPVRHARHAALENLSLVEALCGPADESRLEFTLSEADRERATALLRHDAGPRPWVALQVGAGAPVKVWPLERLARIGRALRDEFGVAIVAIGGPKEVDQVHFVRDAVGRDAIGLAGETSLGELGAVLERCTLAIGPDSGPLHLAVAVGTPSLHLFGPADARRFGPFGDPEWHQIVNSPRPCAPCNRLDFAGADMLAHGCVGDISSDTVLEAARRLLTRSLQRTRLASRR